MVYTIDILCPECSDALVPEPEVVERKEYAVDRTKVTRLQVINIKGEIVDIEQ